MDRILKICHMCLIKTYPIKETQSSPFHLRGFILRSRFYLIFDVTVNIQIFLFFYFLRSVYKPISNEKNGM